MNAAEARAVQGHILKRTARYYGMANYRDLVADDREARELLADLLAIAVNDHPRLTDASIPRGYCDGCHEVGDCDYRDEYERGRALLAEPEPAREEE